jgi:regulator of telomere elongation helicase 1
VVQELKNTRYKPRMAILGSRAQMCVHPTYSKLPSSHQNFQCRTAVHNRSCKFFNNVDRNAEGVMGGNQAQTLRTPQI